ncbi:MAG: deoxycytidylate deaminase [Nanoarchaeota archaeon]
MTENTEKNAPQVKRDEQGRPYGVTDYDRPDWDAYFMEIMETVAKRATCERGRSGCVVVKDKQILCTGYVGSPPHLSHCDDVGHLMKKMVDDDGTIREHCVRTIHAEQNAICQAAKHGIPLDGATLYCRMEPCRVCAMLIIAVGIKRVVCQRRYHAAQETRDMFDQADVRMDVLVDELQAYDHQ